MEDQQVLHSINISH